MVSQKIQNETRRGGSHLSEKNESHETLQEMEKAEACK